LSSGSTQSGSPADAEDDRLADVVLQARPVAREVVVDRQPMFAEADGETTVGLLELRLHEVGRRRADESGDD